MVDNRQIDNEGILYLSILNSELGNINFNNKDHQKALVYLEDAFSCLREQFARIDINQDPESKVRNELKRNIMEVRDKILDVLTFLGNQKEQLKDFQGAIDYYKLALAYNAKRSDIFYNLGKCLFLAEAHETALISLERALSLGYNQEIDIYQMLGNLYIKDVKDPNKAIEYYKKYLERNPDNASIYNEIGHCYDVMGSYDNLDLQIAFFKKAAELKPDLRSAWKNLSIVYPRGDYYKETMEAYSHVMKLNPSNDDYFDYACMLIKLAKTELGSFEEGWKHYERRFLKETGPTPYPKIKKPKWKGQKLNNQTLLVQWEQGFGDTIFFARYLPLLKNYTNKIIFRVQKHMVDLIKLNYGDFIDVISDVEPIDESTFNFHIPLMSLVHILNTTIDTIPTPEKYLVADKERSAYYKKEYFDNDCFKVGISWQGAKIGNHLRDLSIEDFYPLAKLKNVKVYAFQKDIDPELFNRLPEGVEIIDLGKTFNNFNDTAAAMDNVDIFISSDNCVPNLAAAMGKKTIMFLNRNSEWRWFLDEDKTPWYKSIQFIKKKEEKQPWSELMDVAINKYLPKELL